MRVFPSVIVLLAAGWLLVSSLGAQQFESLPEPKPATPAAPTPGAKIGILNIQAAMTQTQEGRKAAEEMQAQFSPRQAELQKLQDEIRSLESQLRTQERTLSNDARLQLGRQIEQKRKEFTRAQQDYQDDAERAQQDYINAIGEKMQRVIDRYARENSLSVVFNAVYWFQGGPFVYAAPTVDITEAIVRLYDQTYPVQAASTPTQSPPSQKKN